MASTLSACAESAVRTVWDGDQIIAEVRAGSWTDSDGDTGDRAGVVLYTHGPGIDAPLSLVRTGLASGTWSIIPHADWRGMYAAGTHPDGSIKRCRNDSCLDLDTEVDWPSGSVGAFFNETNTHQVRKWFGSLIQNQADASGQLYRRNRYYDPASGRFTQEDPIGLAGGLNLYGFGGGDPVGYSDPYGLSACPGVPGTDQGSVLDCPQWLLDVSTNAGEQATAEWADASNNSTGGRRAASTVMGHLSALWTPDTYKQTHWVLTRGTSLLTDIFLSASPSGPNQMSRDPAKPRTVDRVDAAFAGTGDSQPHIHFHRMRQTLNRDGSWGHGADPENPPTLTREEKKWIKSHGWTAP